MTRGNQRDLAREKHAKKEAQKKKGCQDSTPLTARKDRDADIMRQKQLAAEQRKAAEAAKGGKK